MGSGISALEGISLADIKEANAAIERWNQAQTGGQGAKSNAKDRKDIGGVSDDYEKEAKESLFVRLGGAQAVQTVVEKFFRRVVRDQHLVKFFKGVDMGRHMRHMVAFLSATFGGETPWTGPDMRKAHLKVIKEKGLAPKHFDMVAAHLIDALKSAGVEEAMVAEVLELVAPLKDIMFTPGDK